VESEDVQTQPQSINDLQPKMRLQGTVTKTQLYGALVDIGLECDGLVHISQLAPTHINRVTDVVEPGDSVTVWVTKVDAGNRRIGLTMVEPPEKDWDSLATGQTHTGVVTRLENYGAFVDIGAGRPGLLHVREMAAGYVRHPSEIVKVGDEVDVRILKVDRKKRRIDLTLMGADEIEDVEETDEEPALTTMEIALQRAQQAEPSEQSHRGAHQSHPDLSEREDILARTLKLHSQSQDQSK
jgi:ribosomal protein S1